MAGKVEVDETRLATITAWIPGRIDRLFVDTTGVPVRKGDRLVSLYSPELLSAQEELIQALKAVESLRRSGLSSTRETAKLTVDSVREKLRLWGLTSEQIVAIELRGTPSDHMTIYAPMSGIVMNKNAIQGMYVITGTKLYTIADLSHLWVRLDAYESDLTWLRYGQEVEFQAEAYPGEIFRGRIALIDPVLDARTRTVKVRVNVPNADGKLKPEMFMRATVFAGAAAHGAAEEESLLVIPASAPLITGKRAVVYVAVPGEEGTFEGREVVLGPRAGEHYIVQEGLAEDELVVVNGNFKIDSAVQILAKPSMMSPASGAPAAGPHEHGDVKRHPEGCGHE